MTRTEKSTQQGWRKVAGNPLFERLATPHGVSRYLEIVNPLWALDEIRAKVIGRKNETSDATTLYLKPNGNWSGFQAGQFVTFTVEIDGRNVSRCYSLSSAENDTLSITVRRKPDGVVSNFIADHLNTGDVVTLSAAGGDFVLPTDNPALLLIAAGSGITPIMSMLRSLDWKARTEPVTLLYYRRGEAIFEHELGQLESRQKRFNLRLINTPTEGHYSPTQLDNELETLSLSIAEQQTLLCGPAALMSAVENDYAIRQLSHLLHLEHFTLPEPVLPSNTDEISGDVAFATSERYEPNNGQTLLEQAEAAGLQPEFGCRRGICHRCSCNKASGTVRDTITGELSATSNETIRLCVSVPVGDVTLDI